MSTKIKRVCAVESCKNIFYCFGKCSNKKKEIMTNCFCSKCFFEDMKNQGSSLIEQVDTLRKRCFPNYFSIDEILTSCYGKNWKKYYILNEVI